MLLQNFIFDCYFFSWTYSRRSTYCFYKRHEYINVWLYIQVPNIIVGNICWYQEISYYLLHRTIYIISLLYFKYTCDADDVKLAAIELSSFQKTLKIEKKILLKFPERWFEYSFAVGEKWTCVNLPQAVTHDIVERVSDKNTCQKKKERKSSFFGQLPPKKDCWIMFFHNEISSI